MIKLSSFLLVCIAAQIVWNGIKVLLESVTVHVASQEIMMCRSVSQRNHGTFLSLRNLKIVRGTS